MNSIWLRLTFALGISVCGLAGTFYCYDQTQPVYANSAQIPIAQVGSIVADVSKRPPTRLLWQTVANGDNLYSGESIHTAANSEMRIQFTDGRYIDVEPDSIIVLRQLKKEIALDLVEGSLFLDSHDSEKVENSLVLNSKEGSVNLDGASGSISKTEDNEVDLRITEGTATVKRADGKKSEIKASKNSPVARVAISEAAIHIDTSKFKALSPSDSSIQTQDPAHPEPLAFTWEGADPSWEIALLIGENKKSLKEISKATPSASGSLVSQLSLGKHVWKFVARDIVHHKRIAETPLSHVQVQVGSAPILFAPLAKEKLHGESESPMDVSFSWQKPSGAARTELSLFESKNLTEPILKKIFESEQSFVQPAVVQGTYSWSVSAIYDGLKAPMTSEVRSFMVGQTPVAEIVWDLAAAELQQFYAHKAALHLQWTLKARQSEARQIQVKIVSEVAADTREVTLPSETSQTSVIVKKAGRYIASIEAFNENHKLIARSQPQSIQLTEIPLLKEPHISKPLGRKWQTFGSGRLELAWETIPKAAKYFVVVRRTDGKETLRMPAEQANAELKGILPGRYKVIVFAVDEFGRNGRSVTSELNVPNVSTLRPPTIKVRKVE